VFLWPLVIALRLVLGVKYLILGGNCPSFPWFLQLTLYIIWSFVWYKEIKSNVGAKVVPYLQAVPHLVLSAGLLFINTIRGKSAAYNNQCKFRNNLVFLWMLRLYLVPDLRDFEREKEIFSFFSAKKWWLANLQSPLASVPKHSFRRFFFVKKKFGLRRIC